MAMLQNRHNSSDPTVAKRVTLQNLFRPPIDIMFNGDWDAVSYFSFEITGKMLLFLYSGIQSYFSKYFNVLCCS